ncbi:PIR Superfamily Protein [Plasmodium malariae]|uniref:PIR Superfamily Protein n=1 Tax=Plasmodium malariae TaxID=5858 RepID=A0A1A8X9S9_PLAMA|nr:PIR Superfamily Protein [Plasmodium malariae]
MKGEKKADEIIEKLPSYILYEKFNSEDNEVDNEMYCNIFNTVKCKNKDDCVKLCKKIVRNFKLLLEFGKSKNYNDSCLHYKYWVYEEIEKIFEENTTNDDVNAVVSEFMKLQDILTNNYRIYNCKYKFTNEILKDLKEKNKEKYLYVYITNYNNIKSKDFCNKIEVTKYKEYLNFISEIYKTKKSMCCTSGLSICPNLFMSCTDNLDPSKIIQSLGADNDGCSALENIPATEENGKQLGSEVFEPEFLDSILFTDCRIDNNSSNLPCGFIRASSFKHRNVIRVENNEQPSTVTLSSPESQNPQSNENSEIAAQHEKIRMKVGLTSETINNQSLPKKDEQIDLRWKLDEDTKIRCPPKKPSEVTLGLCKYVEELVKRDFLIKEEKSGIYRLKKDKTWPEQALNIVFKREIGNHLEEGNSQRIQVLKANKLEVSYSKNSIGQDHSGKDIEYNILQNTFVRISIVLALVMGIISVFFLYFKFTPFGSRVGKIKKRKKRYRTNFAELNMQRPLRRFIKRTYRHSSRRRFSLVNILP